MKSNHFLGLLVLLTFALIISGCYAQNGSVPASLEDLVQADDSKNEPLNTSDAIGLSDFGEMQLYENAENSFIVTYPSGWTAQDADANDLGVVAGFLAPGEDMNSSSIYITLQVEKLPEGMNLTLAQYGKAALSNLKKAVPDLQILAESDIPIGEQPGHAVVYNLMSEGAKYRVLRAWTVQGDAAYVFTYNAPDDLYDEFAEDASKIIGSLELA
jgi:serine/threonine-protein kinase